MNKYCVLTSDILTQPIEMQLSNKLKVFANCFIYQILNILKKMRTLIAYAFAKLWTAKDVVR